MPRALPVLLACATFGCAPDRRPLVEAHRGAAGYYPQNSRTAMLASIDEGFDAIELDLVLTADGVPVLHHDPWVHEALCERVDGGVVGERVRVDGLSLATLLADYRCGGLPDPDFPNAVLFAEPVMTFDELLLALERGPRDQVVHLDVKFEPGWTPPAERFADAVMSRWVAADLPHPFYVSANTPDAIRAFEDWGRANGRDVPTSLAWPRFPVDASTTAIGLAAELGTTLGAVDPIALAEGCGADGLALYWELARRQTVVRARKRGLDVQLWTLNDPALLRYHARWPVTALITDYPGDLP